MDSKLQEMFNNSTFSISSKSYTYLKAGTYPANPQDHFMVSKDDEEITVVTENVEMVTNIIEKNDNEWLLVALNLAIPFMKGTLFNVSKAIYN